MGNPLKKTMIYLGLADEDSYEEEVEEFKQPSKREQKAAKAEREAAPERVHTTAPVTPLRRPQAVREASIGAVNEILTVHPKQYRDAMVIAENFREGIPVIINLSQMSDAEARRLIDFVSGLSLGLSGRIERVTSKVFLLSPESVAISGDNSVASESEEAAF